MVSNRGIVGTAHGTVAMDFEVVGRVTDIETFAAGSSIRELTRLRRSYGVPR